MTAAYDFRGAPCLSDNPDEQNLLRDLFDSTLLPAHKAAATLCATCPHLMACRDRARDLDNNRTHGRRLDTGPVGTWGGILYGKRHQPGPKVSNAQRLLLEETMFTYDEAKACRIAYEAGDRTDRAMIGNRVYWRMRRRAQKAAS